MALVLASVVEFPLLMLLMSKTPHDWRNSIPLTVLGWYHLPAGYMAGVVLAWIDPGPGSGAHVIQWCGIFIFQLLLTTPIIFMISRAGSYFRKTSS